jgi:lipoprotein-anchoring transpeptidase ErfK/SrfK
MRRVLVALVFALAGVGVAAPGAEPPLTPIAPHVTIVGGVDVGGLSSEQARTLVKQQFGKVLDLRIGYGRRVLSPKSFGLAVGADSAVARALKAKPGAKVWIKVKMSDGAIRAYVNRLAKEVYVAPTNAKLTGLNGFRPAFSGGKNGSALAKTAAVDAIRSALANGARTQVRLPLKAVEPWRTKADFGSVIVIQRASNKLHLYKGDKLVREFSVATGQPVYPTPDGKWRIVTKQRDPWWIPPNSPWAVGAKPIPPGPGNPLGTRWMGLDASGVGIHGTPDAASIGYSASHGCIRMRIPDAEWLFDHVSVGTTVFIIPT